MDQEKSIKPDLVDKIEDLLEERKTRADRRAESEHDNDFDPFSDRRSGSDRRDDLPAS